MGIPAEISPEPQLRGFLFSPCKPLPLTVRPGPHTTRMPELWSPSQPRGHGSVIKVNTPYKRSIASAWRQLLLFLVQYPCDIRKYGLVSLRFFFFSPIRCFEEKKVILLGLSKQTGENFLKTSYFANVPFMCQSGKTVLSNPYPYI